jgi:hypothetical protein
MTILRNVNPACETREICLCVIYNHNYEKNIDKVELIYKGRFKNIYHLMPFYRGGRKNVLSVWGNSYFFSGFVAQGLHGFYDDKYSQYVFVGDDVMLDKTVNENSLRDKLTLSNGDGFTAKNIYGIESQHLASRWWIYPSFRNYLYSANGAQFKHLIPGIPTVISLHKKHGLKPRLFAKEEIQYLEKFLKKKRHFFKYDMQYDGHNIMELLENYVPKRQATEYVYPFAAGFSDFFVIPGDAIKNFAYYAGIFAAAGIFAEMAIPTGMVLTLENIKRPKDIRQHILNFTSTDSRRLDYVKDNHASMKNLWDNWPDDTLLIHPVKLSEWNVDV